MRRAERSLSGRPNFRHCFLYLLKQEVIAKHPSEEKYSSKYQYFLKNSVILLYVRRYRQQFPHFMKVPNRESVRQLFILSRSSHPPFVRMVRVHVV